MATYITKTVQWKRGINTLYAGTPLDKDGKPKYAQKSGVFLDRRHVSVPNYPYVFDLPEPIAKESKKLKIVFAPDAATASIHSRMKARKEGAFRQTRTGSIVPSERIWCASG